MSKNKKIADNNLQKKIDPRDIPAFFDADFDDDEAVEVIAEEKKSDLPKEKKDRDVSHLQYYLGDRELEPFDNSDILQCRLFYQIKEAKQPYHNYVINKKNKRKIGIVSDMQLRHSWRMAHSKDAKKAVKNELFFMTFQEWEQDMRALESYIRKKFFGNSDVVVHFSDVWALSEIEYESVGLKRPQQFMALLQTAILGEIEENKRISRKWKKIKKYLYRVKLEKSEGGIFTAHDAQQLRASLKVKHLNDIRKYDVYILKSLDLDCDFGNIIKDINKAYKEDMARRRDRRYKVRPFICAFLNLALVILVSYTFQYSLIYEEIATYFIMGLMTICVLAALFIVFAGLRGRRRRLVRPEYVYYSKAVKKTIGAFAFVGIFAVMSIFVFYQRYDGYTDTLYYRETEQGIAIAGLVDKTDRSITVPETIEDKPVVEIDLYAFDNTNLNNVYLPEGLKSIDVSAFAGCYSLSKITIPSSVEKISKNAFNNAGIMNLSLQNGGKIRVEDKAFKNCNKLKSIENSDAIVFFGNDAFYNCYQLDDIKFSIDLESIGKRAFYGCTSFDVVDVPSTTKYIGKGAFYYCSDLVSVTVPFAGTSAESSSKESFKDIVMLGSDAENKISVTLNSPVPISSRAFKNIYWISSVNLHKDTPTIDAGAFSGMDNLKSIKLPETTTEIRDGMFEGASALTSITGMSNVTVVGNRAFYGCSSLSEVDLSSVEVMGNKAFAGSGIVNLGLKKDAKIHIADGAFINCSNLRYIENSESIVSVGKESFYGCSRLSDITFSDDLESIGKQAFFGCKSLTSIVVPERTKSIGKGAFYECENLKDITIPYAATSAEKSHRESIESIIKFEKIYGIATVTLNSSAPVGRRSFRNVSWIKSINISDSVTSIDSGAFSGMANLVEIKLPSTLTEINGEMFRGATSLKRITGISGVKTIGDRAFYQCKSLESIDLSDVEIIGREAFSGCTMLSEIGDLSSLEAIGSYVFSDCYELDYNIQIYSTLKKIEDYAFFGSRFTGFHLEEGIKEIGEHAFENCSNLESVYLPSTITSVGDYAFAGCYNLERADLSKISAKTLGGYLFRSCSNLTSVYLPVGMTEIPEGFFYNCQNVRGFDVIQNFASMKIKSIGDHAFDSCSFSGEFVVPSGITNIGNGAFAYNEMSSVIIENNVTNVGNEAFKNCNYISTVVIGNNVTHIGKEAFKNCKNISSVTIGGGLTNLGENAFDECGTISLVSMPFLGETSTDQSKSFMGFGKNGGYRWVFGTTSVKSIEITKMHTIYTNTFKGGETSVKFVTISSYATKIEDSAFESFSELDTVTLPNSISSIGDKAFKNCGSLKSITIPTKVTTISKSMFENCYNLNIDISSLTVKSIEDRAFYGCSQIGKNAYSQTIGKSALEFNPALEKIGANAFGNCYNIDNVVFTYHLKDVDVNAFGMFPIIDIYVFDENTQEKYTELFKLYGDVDIVNVFEINEDDEK